MSLTPKYNPLAGAASRWCTGPPAWREAPQHLESRNSPHTPAKHQGCAGSEEDGNGFDGHDSTLLSDLKALVGPGASRDPESRLRWTCKSARVLARELGRNGHVVCYPVVAKLLAESGYSLQGNWKIKEGSSHSDRSAQFEHVNAMAVAQQRSGQPVVSVDAKKKVWRPAGMPVRVRVYDFIIPANGKAIPYGACDPARNAGWVSIGIDHDTTCFAVSALRRW